MTDITTEQQQSEAESDAALAAGFNASRGIEAEPPQATTPPAQETTTTEAAPAKEEAAPAPTAEQPWKAELDSIRKQLGAVEKVPDRLRNIEGTLGGLSQLTKELKAAMAEKAATAVKADGVAAPTQAQIDAADSPEDWKEMEEDFPAWAALLQRKFAAVRAELAANKPLDTTALKGEITTDVEKRIAEAVKAAEDRVEARVEVNTYLDRHHEGWKKTVNSPAFEAWWNAQPADIQNLGASDAKEDAKRMLDLFAEHQKSAKQKDERKERLERAVAPKGTTVVQAVEDEDAAFSRGFKKATG